VRQAAQAILVKANANAADYTRVVQALARVLGA
jgi:Flp pilus assembly protein TadD